MSLTKTRTSFLILILFFCLTCDKILTLSFNLPHYKLPSTIFPTKYQLHINTLIHQNISVYNGSVSIDLTVKKPTNEIVLNTNRLREFNITLIDLDSGVKFESPKLEYEIDENRQMLRIFWPQLPLKLQIDQQYQLRIDFVGDIQEDEEERFGFFKSIYKDDLNNSIPIATTQFEPNSARLAFPCFDEITLKAKFVVSITHGANYSALSNMPVDGEPIPSETSNGPMLTTTFLETPTMSTYLLAFAITNYKMTSVSANGRDYRFFNPPNSKNNGSLAIANAIQTVEALEKLLGVKYPLAKLDQFEIPKSFGRAMENWGLMSFQHRDVLSNEINYNKLELLDLIIVQNHEIAHQWFGNLVTPALWDCIWLKEGLSSYFSFIAADMVYPEEKFIEYFILMEVDTLSTRGLDHPLTYVIKEGESIDKSLDIVAYKLGGCLTRMFHHAIGQSTFTKGITKYLNDFQYAIAGEDDLYGAIQAAIDEDQVLLFQGNQSVANVMRTWTHNQGIPTISIVRNYDTGTITIYQEPHTPSEANPNELWWIPMSFTTAANPDFERTTADYIMPPVEEVTIDLKDFNVTLSNADWLMVNKQQTGIFYVIYDDLNLKLIADALVENKNVIHHFNRAHIFRDLSETLGALDAIEPMLRLLEYLQSENESLPWFYALDLMFTLIDKMKDSKLSTKLKNFLFEMYADIFEKYENGKLESATDLKTKIRMTQFNFNIDSPRCRNFTTPAMAGEYFLMGNVDEAILTPCKLALCEAIQNATIDEFKAYITRMASFGYDSVERYEFITTLRCLKLREEIIECLVDIVEGESKDNVKNLAALSYEILYYSIKNSKVGTSEQGDDFLSKYGQSIDSWIENYKRKE